MEVYLTLALLMSRGVILALGHDGESSDRHLESLQIQTTLYDRYVT